MIRLKEVSKEIKGNFVLKDINIELNEGNLYLLKGHNGCGKTMLLRMICGLITPTTGIIEKDNSYDFGVLIENPKFLENETGFYNLKYLASIRNIIGKEQIDKSLRIFNIYDVRNKKVKSYSLGMKQRLGIAQAFMEDPDVILLDEPFNALDEKNFNLVFDYIKTQKTKGKIIVVVTHTLEQAKIDEFDQVIDMDNGKITKIHIKTPIIL